MNTVIRLAFVVLISPVLILLGLVGIGITVADAFMTWLAKEHP